MTILASNIRGWMNERELSFLGETARNKKIIVEAGSYCGRSTRAMADTTLGIVYAIDPWDGSGYTDYRDLAFQSYENKDNVYKEFCENLKDYILNWKVIPCKVKFENFHIENPDFIFIDAVHERESVKRDINHALDLLGSGGILAGHDYSGNWPDVIEVVDEMFGNRVNVVESIWWVNL